MASASSLALLGGTPAIAVPPSPGLFEWPIITSEDEEAVLDVLRRGAMSGNEISKEFEREYAEWAGTRFALTYPNGTEALRAAFWACGVGAGDEIICPSLTYWASCTPALSLGAAVNFADVHRDTLCIDPADIEHRIGPRTRLIVAVHIIGHPCDMDPIMDIARRHGIKVVEDISQAAGARYKGRALGTFGDVACTSLMSGKGLAAGEGGMMTTNDRTIYERCISYGFYERTGVPSRFNAPDAQVSMEELTPYIGVPMGGFKHRLNQLSSAMGRVQLRHYPERMREIQAAMNRFWDMLDGAPGLKAHRVDGADGSTMGGWYTPRGLYRAEEAGGLSCERFCEAVRAEGFDYCWSGFYPPLHLHPVFNTADLFRQGRPTMVAFGQRDVRQGPGSLPVSESVDDITYFVPAFKKDRPADIRRYADAFRKVAENADALR